MNLSSVRIKLRVALDELSEKFEASSPVCEVFYVRDPGGSDHLPGWCIPSLDNAGVTWAGRPEGAGDCDCLDPLNGLGNYIIGVQRLITDNNISVLFETKFAAGLTQAYPQLLNAWKHVQSLAVQLVLSDSGLHPARARRNRSTVSDLPTVGACTLRLPFPERLAKFPNGVPVDVEWVTLPEEALFDAYWSVDLWVTGVAGWPAERVTVLNTLLLEAGSEYEASTAFKVAEQLVP